MGSSKRETDAVADQDITSPAAPEQPPGAEQTPVDPERTETDADAPSDGGKARIAELTAELEALGERLNAREQQYVRLRADFDNFRRRKEQEAAEANLRAGEAIVRDLLPVADNLERAVAAAARSGADAQDALIKGVEMVVGQLAGLLARHGVEPIASLGQAFDPLVHEAVMEVDAAPEQAGRVVEELQKGYRLGGIVLRPAMVKVGRA